MSANATFGQWLKQCRKALDFTREGLAQRIGCAAATPYKIEAGERRPSKQITELLSEHLGISLAEHSAFVQFARSGMTGEGVPWGTPFSPPTNLPAAYSTDCPG